MGDRAKATICFGVAFNMDSAFPWEDDGINKWWEENGDGGELPFTAVKHGCAGEEEFILAVPGTIQSTDWEEPAEYNTTMPIEVVDEQIRYTEFINTYYPTKINDQKWLLSAYYG